MNRLFFILWVLTLNLMSCTSGLCANNNVTDGKIRLYPLIEKLQLGEIKEIEILWMDPSAESRNTVTPEVLDKLYFRKLAIKKLSNGTRTSLTEAVRATLLTKIDPTAEGDVRWAIKFYERRNGPPTFSIYLDASGATGTVGAVQYSFNPPLVDWLSSNFFTMSVARTKTRGHRHEVRSDKS